MIKKKKNFENVTGTSIVLNVPVNPIIYFIRNRRYDRPALKTSIMKLVCKSRYVWVKKNINKNYSGIFFYFCQYLHIGAGILSFGGHVFRL